MPRLRPFDIAGIASVLFFVAVVAADLDALRFMAGESTATVSAAEQRAGFREGVAWYGFYLREVKMGFSRVERRHHGHGYTIRVHSLFRPTVFGRPTTVDLDLEAELDRAMALSSIELEVDSSGARFSASGEVSGSQLDLLLRGAGLQHQMSVPLEQAPSLDLTVRPALLAGNPEVGSRTSYETFDPMTLGLRTIEVEYRGRDTIEVLGDSIDAHLLRQSSEGQTVLVWVNELGEVLQEEMPLGIVALRESEADATWGLGKGASLPTAEVGGLGDLLSMIGPLAGPNLSALTDAATEEDSQ